MNDGFFNSIFHVSAILKPGCVIPATLKQISSTNRDEVKLFRYWFFPCSFCDRSGWIEFDRVLKEGEQDNNNNCDYDRNNYIVSDKVILASVANPLGLLLEMNEEVDDSDDETNLM